MTGIKIKAVIKELLIILAVISVFIIAITAYLLGMNTKTETIKTINYSIETCPKNMYIKEEKAVFNEKECKKIEQTNCDLIKKLKQDPLKYAINPETQKEVYWKLGCKNNF